MAKEPRVHELITLKTIAETLNQPGELTPMLTLVLDKLLELTGLSAGWIFLSDGRSDYVLAADCGLPPALLHQDKLPMKAGRCWCMDRYRDGKLNNAVNIMSCKRLEDALAIRSGDTWGITHHATVPLRSGSRRVGVLNVAAPGKEKFSDEELALLQSVAFQIGGAVERMHLYAAEQRRADLFERLGHFSRSLRIATMTHPASIRLGEQAVALIAAHFEWKFAAIMERVGDDFIVCASHTQGRLIIEPAPLDPAAAAWLRPVGEKRRMISASGNDAVGWMKYGGEELLELAAITAVHVPNTGLSLPWVIVVGDDQVNEHAAIEGEVLKALGEHFAVALDSASLEANRRELARLDERNRIARDLHDSVCQMLFSLSMTAKGTESLLSPVGDGMERKTEIEAARRAVKDMQALSQQALKEMRELIMQLRPAGLETVWLPL